MKKGFTLPEVLLTIVIIGIVAALTVPGFLNNSNQQEYKSAIKKAISAVNQALMQTYALTGLSAQDYSSAESLIENVFLKRMNVVEGLSAFTSNDCNGPVFTTDDGIVFCINNYSSSNIDRKGIPCDSYNSIPCVESDGPNLWIDVNGVKKPNRATTSYQRPKDIYQAQIYSHRVIPYGEPTQQVMYEKIL